MFILSIPFLNSASLFKNTLLFKLAGTIVRVRHDRVFMVAASWEVVARSLMIKPSAEYGTVPV